MSMNHKMGCDCMHCRNELNLDKLCAKRIDARHIEVENLEVENLQVDDQICAPLFTGPNACLNQLVADKADVNSECVTDLSAKNACIQNLNAPNASLGNVVVNNLCVPGELNANLKVCSRYEATAVYSANTTYTLGDLLNFNLILSNPSGALLTSPTTYVAPVTGNYIVMFQIDQQNLVPTTAFGPILGVPVANPQMILNGVVHRELYSAYLTFFNQQRSTMTALVTLNTGDQLQFKYKVLALNQSSGVSEIAGTVDILGNGSTNDQSVVKIELISVDCGPNPVLPCQPVVACAPCIPMQCTPCTPDGCEPCQPCKPMNMPMSQISPTKHVAVKPTAVPPVVIAPGANPRMVRG